MPDRIKQAIDDRRRELRLTVGQLVERSGVTAPALAPLRNGEPKNYAEATKLGLADALRWPPDAVDRLFAGETPDASWNVTPLVAADPVVSSVSADLEVIRREDPEQYELLAAQLRLAAQRARRNI